MHLWATDIHLDKLTKMSVKDWGKNLKITYPATQSLIITGDISTGSKLEQHLKELVSGFQSPIYFVLGNHDYWNSSFEAMDEQAELWQSFGLTCLENKVIRLSDDIALVGTSGFYDCTYGDFDYSYEEMTDFYKIQELLNPIGRRNVLETRSATLGHQLISSIEQAKKSNYKNIIVATHVPPFLGLVKDLEETILPFYASGNIGNAIYAAALTAKNKLAVLCGHSHEQAYFSDEYVKAYCGEAKYCAPEVCGTIDENTGEVYFL